MNNELFVKLITVLKKEYGYYSQLNELAQAKSNTIVANNIEELSELLKKDDELITALKELEGERSRIISELANLYQLEAEEINYSFLIKYLPQAWQKRFSLLREKLLIIIDELHDQNEDNRVLVEEAMRLNNFSINILMQVLEPDNQTYQKKDNAQGQINHIIDRKA